MPLTEKEFNLFKKYCELDGVSGYEHEVRRALRKDYKKFKVQILGNDLGAVIAFKKSKVRNAPKVLLDAHMDEVGFIVGYIKDNGLLQLIPIGGINLEEVKDAKYKLLLKDGEIVFGTMVDIENQLFDFGYKSKEEALRSGVNYGNMVTFYKPFELIKNDLYTGKAIDDKYGIVLGLEILEYFNDIDLPFDLYVCAATQEEVGLRSAAAIANQIDPDLVIALDCSRAVNSDEGLGHMGQGVLLRFFDPSMIAFKELIELQKDACTASGANYQYFSTRGGTNAGMYHRSNKGIFTLNHCICAQDIHTDHTVMNSNDYQDAKKSLIELLAKFNKKTLDLLRKSRQC